MAIYEIQQGTTMAPEQYKITVMDDGPYMVYGGAPLRQLFITPNDEGNSWTYQGGKEFSVPKDEPTAVCRCGASKQKPYCDGNHVIHDWDPALTAPVESILDGANSYSGPRVTLTDNEKYCAFARFCDGKGRVWNLTQVDDETARENVIYEANHCPAGRLSAWDNVTGEPFEPQLPVSLGVMEDPAIHCSAGIFATGGIPLSKEDGTTYQVRNRMALCRCGQSSNKPFCNGTHASMRFQDGIGGGPTRTEF